MKILEERINKLTFLQADIEFLDASNAVEFKKEMHAKLSSPTHHIISLQKVSFMDSTGLGALVSCLRKTDEANGRLVLFGLQPAVRTLFELVRLYKVFEIYDSKEDVLQAYST